MLPVLGVASPGFSGPEVTLALAFLLMAVAFLALWLLRRGSEARARHLESLAAELSESQARLAEGEAHFRTLFDDDPLGRFVLTSDGTLIEWNFAFLRFLDRAETGLERMSLAKILPDAGPLLERRIQEAAEGGDSLDPGVHRANGAEQVEVRVQTRTGLERVGLVSLSSYVTGKGIEFRGSVVDITEQKELQIQLLQSQKLEAVGRLAGGLAHDLNNMLTTIFGNAESLLDEEEHGPRTTSDLEDIRGAAERAAVLTRRLLTLTRRDIAQPIDLSFNDLIRENAPSLQRMIGPNIELVSLLGEPMGAVRMDPAQAEQVLLNLVVNAKDAMPRGGKLVLETEFVPAGEKGAEGPGNGHEVVLKVSDTGVGMTEEVKSRIFDPFFSTKADGSGLGLATVLGIVSQWGGSIMVRSAPGSGAIFEIRLPAAPATRGESEVDRTFEEAVAPVSGTVLVVDDEPTIRAFVRKALEKAGCSVVETENGASAHQILQENPFEFDLLLTDLVMPIMGGFALAEKARSINPDLPVIFMSGYAEEVSVDREFPEVRRPFLKKPFKPSELVSMVRSVLEGAPQD